MKTIKNQLLTAAAAIFLAACSSTPTPDAQTLTSSIPTWVLTPAIDDGIAATECVNFSGNMNIDKAQAVASARANITKQINVKVQTMDKTYSRKTETGDKIVTSNVFETVSKQLAKQSLVGSRPEKVEIVDIAGKQQLCAMVTLKADVTEKLFTIPSPLSSHFNTVNPS